MKSKRKVINHLKKNKKVFAVYIFLRFLVIIMMVFNFISGNYENVYFCFLSLILFLVPSLMEMKLSINFPDTLEIIVLLFIFASQILGEIYSFYHLIPFWDSILHTINGFVCAGLGFSMIDVLNQSDKFHIQLTPLFVAIVGFCFSMTIGIFWEFFEYGNDVLTNSDMQKDIIVTKINSSNLNESITDINKTLIETKDGVYIIDNGYLDIGLIDTMDDLLVNFIGAIIFCTIGYFYVKKRGEGTLVKKFIIEYVPKK
ncbi:MAG: hypothetical protein E7172_05330 [Firmicutes bacterium]|nr:hypothetical protein [Bacillota bacterium]